MGIDNISNSNSINRSLIEQNNDLSKEEKENLLSIFDAVDEQEEDNQKGTITTFDSMNKFLGQIKENIGDKYNKFLDSINLSFLKNDKNTNGVIDEDDFSDEDLEKIENNDLLEIFEGAEWTPEISKIFSAILHNETVEDEIIKITHPITTNQYNKHIIYDTKNRTLKIGYEHLVSNRYNQFESKNYDVNGNLISNKTCLDGKKYYKDGRKLTINPKAITWLCENEGLTLVSENQVSDEKKQIMTDLFYGSYKNVAFEEENYIYDSNNVLIEQTSRETLDNGNTKFSSTQNDITTVIVKDSSGNFVEKTVLYPQEELEGYDAFQVCISNVTEQYDENDNLLCKTTKINRYYKEQKNITKGRYTYTYISETEIIKAYPNGKKYIETEALGNFHGVLKDSNDNIIEEYDITKEFDYGKNKMKITKTYPDGHQEIEYADAEEL